ncbi:hypothetical protein [Frigoriflavimonas asaccharolytica]|uniref:Uncharacterized protein n=1 Tax=Frigoriflavimonas asaccharolytica TaxID=2735899 RepID=A0A8J8GAT8_9FLAO|nr:hypothetical protein [Frigoriflavimonas asaccharolytica]NRS94101.1 hypothetical protein [Frigoriflavimonas asaccharolytica]
MRKLLVIFCAGISFLGCSQKEKTLASKDTKVTYDINKHIFPEAKHITEDNFVYELNSQIKHYNNEPIYYFRIHKQNCLIEVYVNDIFNNDDYELSNYITPINIYPILKSGKQEVTVKMYPVGNLINEDLGRENAPPSTTLSDNAEVEIEVIMMDNKSKKRFDDEKSIVKHMNPKEVAGKEYYEFSFTFDADVPYEFEGWTKGQDLRKLDQDLVREKAEEFYKMVGEIHVKNDLDSELKIVYPSTIRIRQVLYKDNNIKKLFEEYKEYVVDDYNQLPIINYTLQYMGNGKLLRLITNNLDTNLRGGGALKLEYGKDKDIFQPGITLFLPEGRDLATQGFMMWK